MKKKEKFSVSLSDLALKNILTGEAAKKNFHVIS